MIERERAAGGMNGGGAVELEVRIGDAGLRCAAPPLMMMPPQRAPEPGETVKRMGALLVPWASNVPPLATVIFTPEPR